MKSYTETLETNIFSRFTNMYLQRPWISNSFRWSAPKIGGVQVLLNRTSATLRKWYVKQFQDEALVSLLPNFCLESKA